MVLKKQETTDMIEHRHEVMPAVEPTCTEKGLTEGEHCAICGEIYVEQAEIEPLGHGTVDSTGKCERCGEFDKSSAEYKVTQLRLKADELVYGLVEKTLLKVLDIDGIIDTDTIRNFEMTSFTIIEKDEYLRYSVKVSYTAEDIKDGRQISDIAYFIAIVNPKLNRNGCGMVYDKSSIDTPITQATKEKAGWGEKPDNWTLEAIRELSEAVPVTVEDLAFNPEKYNNMFVRVDIGELRENDNDFIYWMYIPGIGNRKWMVVYESCENYEECKRVIADYQTITVYGYFRYSTPWGYSIDALKIEF